MGWLTLQGQAKFVLYEQRPIDWCCHMFQDEDEARAWIIATRNGHMHHAPDVHGRYRKLLQSDHPFCDSPTVQRDVERIRFQLIEARQAQEATRQELAEAIEHVQAPRLPRITRAFEHAGRTKEFSLGQTVWIASKPATQAKVIGFGQGSVLVEFLNASGDKVVLREIWMDRAGSGLTFDAISLDPPPEPALPAKKTTPGRRPTPPAISPIRILPGARVMKVSEAALLFVA